MTSTEELRGVVGKPEEAQVHLRGTAQVHLSRKWGKILQMITTEVQEFSPLVAWSFFSRNGRTTLYHLSGRSPGLLCLRGIIENIAFYLGLLSHSVVLRMQQHVSQPWMNAIIHPKQEWIQYHGFNLKPEFWACISQYSLIFSLCKVDLNAGLTTGGSLSWRQKKSLRYLLAEATWQINEQTANWQRENTLMQVWLIDGKEKPLSV